MAKFYNKIMYKNKELYLIYLKNLESDILEKDADYISETPPQIFFYYFNPIFEINTDIILEYYVTDFYNSDYNFGITDKKYKITVYFENKEFSQIVNIGDNTLNLGSISYETDTFFIIKAEDLETHVTSYEQTILLSIQDPTQHILDNNNTYYMTETDLLTYSINNNDSKIDEDLVNTRKGITKFLQDKSDAGYKKIVLLENSVFRMDYSNVSNDGTPIIIPDNTIVDMNGSTFRIHPQSEITSVGNIIVTNNGNSHTVLENGTLQGSYKGVNDLDNGDWDTFQKLNEKGEIILEGAGSYNFSGGKYNTLRNMNIKNIQGYSITANSHTDNDFAIWHNISKNTCKSCYIKSGEEIPNDDMLTTDFIEIPSYIKEKSFVCFNRFKGYMGYKGRNGLEFFHWYDSDKNFIKTVKGHQMRWNYIPENAKYTRITLFYKLEDTTYDSAHLQYNDFSTHVNIENVHSYDTRTCAIATSDYNFLRINNCTFERCGRSITPASIDLEDGYEYGHNLFMTNCDFIDSPSTQDIICNYGDGMYFENISNCSIEIRTACYGLTLKNCNNTNFISRKGYDYFNGIFRVYDNNFIKAELSRYDTTDSKLLWDRIIKNGTVSDLTNLCDCTKDKFYGCTFNGGNINGGHHENMIINSVSYVLDKNEFDFCEFNCNFAGNSTTVINNSTFNQPTAIACECNDCTFKSNVNIRGNVNVNNCGTINYTGSVILDVAYGHYFIGGGGNTKISNCIINYDCNQGSFIGLCNQRGKYADTDSVTFENCTINLCDGAILLDAYYNSSESWMPKDIGFTVNFINCTLNGNYTILGSKLANASDRYIVNFI